MTLNATRSMVHHISVTGVPCSQILVRFALRHVSRSAFWDKCIELPRMTLNTKRSKISHLCVSPSPKFHSVSLYDQLFWSHRAFWDKCIEWPQWPWTLQGQRYPHICVTSVPEMQISFHFALRPAAFFWDTRMPKIANALNDLGLTLNDQKYPVYTKYYPRRRQTLVRFALRPAVSVAHFVIPYWLLHTKQPKRTPPPPKKKAKNVKFNISQFF